MYQFTKLLKHPCFLGGTSNSLFHNSEAHNGNFAAITPLEVLALSYPTCMSLLSSHCPTSTSHSISSANASGVYGTALWFGSIKITLKKFLGSGQFTLVVSHGCQMNCGK